MAVLARVVVEQRSLLAAALVLVALVGAVTLTERTARLVTLADSELSVAVVVQEGALDELVFT